MNVFLASDTKIRTSTLSPHMIRTLILFLLFFSFHKIEAREVIIFSIEDSTAGNSRVIPPDTIPPRTDLFDEFVEEDEEDTSSEESYDEVFDEDFCALIQCDLYDSVWDTLKINPYGIDMKKRTESTMLQLVQDASCDYIHPVCGNVTSDFGFRSSRYHYGIDIDLETGDEVYAAFEGTVRISKYSPTYGNYVIIRHLNGLETLYAHLSARNVSPGQYLQAGDILGLGGNTGRSRGSHLHFEVRFLGQQINPRDIISFDEYACASESICISPESFSYLKAVEKQKAKMAAARYYKIRKGDTLGKIARKQRTTVSKLCKLNKMSSKTVLRVGKRIRVH
ncbi:MAG: peptidoglycan DD-metalloendopeptidase family protein [Bacteroidia bacterium]